MNPLLSSLSFRLYVSNPNALSGKRKFDLNLTGELTEFPVAMIQILHWLLFCRDVRYRWIISFPLSLRLPQPHQLLITMIGSYLPGNSISNISYTYIICMFALLRRRYLDNWEEKKVQLEHTQWVENLKSIWQKMQLLFHKISGIILSSLFWFSFEKKILLIQGLFW